MQLEHRDRQQWVAEITRINQPFDRASIQSSPSI
jgi:hypothetical protein